MSWVGSIIASAFSGLSQGFLSLFGMSDAQRLGRAQVENTDLKADNELLKAQEQALENKETLDDALRHHDF